MAPRFVSSHIFCSASHCAAWEVLSTCVWLHTGQMEMGWVLSLSDSVSVLHTWGTQPQPCHVLLQGASCLKEEASRGWSLEKKRENDRKVQRRVLWWKYRGSPCWKPARAAEAAFCECSWLQDWGFSVILWYPRGPGSWTLQMSKFLDAQVLYIKWCGICIEPTHIIWLCHLWYTVNAM